MSTEQIRIGCRLPLGIKLEVGYTASFLAGPQNRPVARYERQDNYQAVQIAGTRSHTRELRRQGFLPPARLNAEPAFTMVPKDFWEEWKAKHPGASLIKGGQLFEAPGNKDNVKAAAVDASAKPKVFEPMDPSKKVKVGDDTVMTADFHEENVQRSSDRADA